jgi:hypothetical protein
MSVHRLVTDLEDALVMLLRERLVGPNPAYHKAYEKREDRKAAIYIGAQLLVLSENCSIRRIAEIMGVEPSTVSRWFPNDELRLEAERVLSYLSDEEWLSIMKKEPLGECVSASDEISDVDAPLTVKD